jgi:hypothetical protein
MKIETKFSIGDYVVSKDNPWLCFRIAQIVICADGAIYYKSECTYDGAHYDAYTCNLEILKVCD